MGDTRAGLHSQCSIHINPIRTMTLDIPPPPSLSTPIHVPLKTLTGPGPSNVSQGVDWAAVSGHCMKNPLVEISGGLGPTAGKVWRIGVMGNNANIKTVSKVLDALREALKAQEKGGHNGKQGY